MVEQLWYTWSSVGISKIKGFQVRAASEGLSDLQSQQFKEMDSQLRYYLPTGTDLYEATTATSPTTLSLIRTGAGNIIVHKVYVGTSDGDRPGNYFCHALAGLPYTFTACDAIGLWKSSFWRNSDSHWPESSLTLPTIGEDALIAGPLDYADLREVEEFLPFVIQAFLLLKFDQRLYIYAPDKIVAALIWGLAHCLPRSMLRHLTFSTYEQNVDKENVDKANIRVVGSCRAPTTSADQNEYAYTSRQQDLPGDCYSGGRGYAINYYTTNKRSQLPQGTLDAIFAQFATQCLVNPHKRNDLITMLEEVKRINFDDVGSFLVYFKLYTTDEKLSEQEVTDLLGNYELAAILLKREGIKDAIIELLSRNPQWWKEHGATAFERLAHMSNVAFGENTAEALHSLAMNAVIEACNSAFRQDWTVFNRLMLLVVKITPLAKDPTVWTHLQSKLTEPGFHDPSYHPGNIFSWEWHVWLLTVWQDVADKIPDRYIQPWLEISWEELEALLEKVILSNWHIMSIESLILDTSIPIPPQVSSLVLRYYELFETVLKRLVQNPSTQTLAIGFFQQMVKYGCQKKLEMLLVLLNYPIDDKRNFELLLRSANLTPAEMVMVFEYRTRQLLRNVASSPTAQNMVELYVGNFTLDNLGTSAGREALQMLQGSCQDFPPQLNGASSRINAWYLASEGYPPKGYIPPLKVEEKHLKAMRDAIISLRLADQAQYRDRLFRIIINTPLKYDELDLIIKCFAPVFARNQSRKELLTEIGTFIGSKYKKNENNPDLWKALLPYTMLALAYTHELPDSAKDRFINYILPKGILQHVDKETFDKIDHESENWPPEIREEWDFYVSSLHPTSLLEKIIGVPGKFLRRTSQPPLMQNAEAQFGVSPSANQGKPSGVTAGEPRLPTSGTPPVDPTQRSHNQPMPTQRNVTQPDQTYLVPQNHPLNPEWVEKVRRVRNVYYSIKKSQLQKQIDPKKDTKEKSQLLKEKDDLQRYLDLGSDEQTIEIQRELAVDQGFQEQFKNAPEKKRMQDALSRELADTFKEINRSKGYRSHLNEIRDDEIKEALTIYIRREIMKK